jgi:curved DNA-binding protein CbpA
MVKKIEDLNFYELLEVSPTASSQDIHRAYERIRRVYEPNSIALYSLFTAEETAVIYQRVEEAYRTLLYETKRKKYDEQLRASDHMPEPAALPSSSQPTRYEAPTEQPPLALQSVNRYGADKPKESAPEGANSSQEEVSPVSPFIAEFTGPVIKVLREQRSLTLRQIADVIKVSVRYIEAIEEESFQKLPARPYLRGFLMLYAKVLGYEPERLAVDYLKRYDAWAAKPK